MVAAMPHIDDLRERAFGRGDARGRGRNRSTACRAELIAGTRQPGGTFVPDLDPDKP